MKRHLLILLPVFLFAVVPAFAAQDGKDKNKDKENKNKNAAVVQEETEVQVTTVTPSVVVTVVPSTNCDPNANWKNHGQYVSCVAHEGRGGKAVSEAARSDVGKKHKGPKPSGAPTVTPSSTPSGTPSATPSIIPSESPTVSPSAVPSGSPSATPSVSPEGTTTVDTAQLQAIITALEGILNFFKNLL